MREARAEYLLFILACGILLLGLVTCQSQGESRNQVGQTSYEDTRQQQDSVEYYDEEYYDEEEEVPVKEEAPREPKATKTDNTSKENTTICGESYYYDDDYEACEETALADHQDGKEEKPVAEAAINRTSVSHNEDRVEQEVKEELPISPERPEKVGTNSEPSVKDSILIGEAIVSVVTTKSVVNGTYSIPETTTNPPPTTTMVLEDSTEPVLSSSTTSTTSTTDGTTSSTSTTTTTSTTSKASTTTTTTAPTTTTTELTPSSTTIQASVQTGRSVSGARFLPFPSVDKVEQLDSTESIIDKLDRVQSELSSGFLANGRFEHRYKKPFSDASQSTSSTVSPSLSSTTARVNTSSTTKRPKIQTTLDDIAAFLPKDFPGGGNYKTSTTAAPLTKRPKIQTTLDDVEAFLPKDFPRGGFNRPSTSTKRPKLQTTLDDLEGFLPKDYPKSGYRGSYKRPSYKTTSTTVSSTATTTTTTTTTTEPTTEKNSASTRRKALTTIEDISAFLPPGYKLKKNDVTTEKSTLLSEILSYTKSTNGKEGSEISTSTTEKAKSIQDLFAKSAVDISALLPPGYKPESTTSKPNATNAKVDPIQELLSKSSVDISALLPSGYKPVEDAKSTKSVKSGDVVQDLLDKSNVDISALLPSGFDASNKNEGFADQSGVSTTKSPNGSSFKLVFPSRPGGRKPIHKITTPSSGNRVVAESTSAPRIQKGWPTRATTEFTGWPTSSTTPISIEKLLEAARTATVSSVNISVLPTTSEISSTSTTTTTTTTTSRPTTPGICDEECEVAGTIKIVENATWVPELLDRNTREWQDLAEEIEREMNLVFAKSPVLRKWFRNIRIDSFSQGSILVDYFVELADLKEKINTQQLKVIFHDSLRTFNFDNPMEATPKGPMKLGKFTIDPKSTDFIVIPRVAAPKLMEDENRLIPQWAIAVIVIGVGGLLFIIVFGVSVLVNRQHGSKLKPSITSMYEEEVSKNVMSHAAPPARPVTNYQKNESQTVWNDAGWHDKPFESTSHKILVDGLPYERKYNMYDSWKSEWNGYYYPPTHASGSHFSGHHSDYDVNF